MEYDKFYPSEFLLLSDRDKINDITDAFKESNKAWSIYNERYKYNPVKMEYTPFIEKMHERAMKAFDKSQALRKEYGLNNAALKELPSGEQYVSRIPSKLSEYKEVLPKVDPNSKLGVINSKPELNIKREWSDPTITNYSLYKDMNPNVSWSKQNIVELGVSPTLSDKFVKVKAKTFNDIPIEDIKKSQVVKSILKDISSDTGKKIDPRSIKTLKDMGILSAIAPYIGPAGTALTAGAILTSPNPAEAAILEGISKVVPGGVEEMGVSDEQKQLDRQYFQRIRELSNGRK